MPARLSLFALVTALTAVFLAPSQVAAQACTDIVPPPGCFVVDVTPHGGSAAPHTPNTSGHSQVFTVQNIGEMGDTYSLSCGVSGPVTCTGLSQSSVVLSAQQSAEITAYYSVGAAGSGSLTLTATGSHSASDIGSYTIVVATYSVAVTPDDSTGPARTANTSGHSQVFAVKNTGTVTDSFSIACAGAANVSCTGTSSASVILSANASTNVTANYNVSDGGTGALTLTATSITSGSATDLGSYVVPVTLPSGAPRVDASVMSLHKQSYAACAQACFAVTHAQSTVPYFSLSTPRHVTLVYNSDRHTPQQFVHLNIQRDTLYGSTPAEWRLQVKVNGTLVTFTNGDQTLKFAYGSYGNGVAQRIGGLFSTASYATGVYPMDILVAAYYSGGGGSTITTAVTTKLVVVKETSAPVAAGWTLGGIQRLYPAADGSALITEGDGSAVFFQKSSNPGPFAAPAGEFSQLVIDGSGWKRLFADSTKITFNSAGRMTEVRDRWNNTVTVVYDGSNRVWKVKDPLDTATVLTYGSYGLSSIAAKGRTTTITVDGSNKLTVIKDPDNDSTRFAYDGSSRLSTITNRGGHASTLTYDAWGKLATDSGPSISVIEPNGSSANARPTGTYAAWHRVGVPTSSTASTPAAAVRADTVWATVTEPGGSYTRFTVNRWGAPARVKRPYGYETTAAFDIRGLPTLMTGIKGDTTSIAYDTTRGLPTYVRSHPDSAVRTRYAGWAQPDSAWGHLRPVTRNVIGSYGAITSSTVGGATTTYRYDSRGRPDSVVDALGYLAQRTWYSSTNGNPTKDSVPGGRVTLHYYDQYGRDTAVSHPGYPVQRVHYDALNRPTHAYNGVYDAVPTVTYYNKLSVDSVKDAKGQKYAFVYNAAGWLIQKVDAVGVAETLSYSRDGDLRRWVNRRNQAVTFVYDSLHRLTSKTGTNTPAESWAYGYTASADSVVAADSFSTETIYVGRSGRADSVKTQFAGYTYWRRYRYYANGLLDSVAVSGPPSLTARKYTYTSDAYALESIKLGALPATILVPNGEMLLTRVKLPGGDSTQFQHTSVQNMAQQYSSGSYAATVNRFGNYDIAQRLSRHVWGDGVNGTDFAYDSLGRLASVTDVNYAGGGNPCTPPNIIDENGNECTYEGSWTSGSPTTFQYDSVGNRRDLSGTYGTGNRIQQFDSCSYVTDSLGNVTRRSCGADTVRFHWTAESRLKALKVIGGDSLEFAHDANGRLLRRKRNGSVDRWYVWDGGNLLAELNGAGSTLIAEYSYYPSLDSLHAVIVGGTQYFAHYDALGNVIALTDTAENLARTYGYTPWGALTGGGDYVGFSNADRARFKGALWGGPDVDLYYMRNRWYEPKTGRFLSEDPKGLGAGVNQYAFAEDDPINNVDPTGLDPANACRDSDYDLTPEDPNDLQCRARPSTRPRAHYAYAQMMGVGGFHTGWWWRGALDIAWMSQTITFRFKSGFAGCPDFFMGGKRFAMGLKVIQRKWVGNIWIPVEVGAPFAMVELVTAYTHDGLKWIGKAQYKAHIRAYYLVTDAKFFDEHLEGEADCADGTASFTWKSPGTP